MARAKRKPYPRKALAALRRIAKMVEDAAIGAELTRDNEARKAEQFRGGVAMLPIPHARMREIFDRLAELHKLDGDA
jgi:hypothetical protein